MSHKNKGLHKQPIMIAVKQTVSENAGLACLLFLAVAGSVIVGILPPLALERIVNLLTDGKTFSIGVVLLYFLLLCASGILDAGKESLITVFGQKATHEIRSCMCRKLKTLPADYFTKQDTGTTVSRFVNDVDTVETLFTSGVISMIADAFRMVSILAVIFIKSPGLGILLLIALPFLYLLTRCFQKRMLAAQLDNRRAVGRANNHVPDTIRSIRMIHNLHKEDFMEERYDSYIQDGFRAVNRANFYDAIYSPIIITVSAILVATMMIMSAGGGWFMQFFGMSVGTAVAVIAYVGKIFEPLESIGMEIQNIQAAAAGIHRINEFMEEPEITGAAGKSGEPAAEAAVPALKLSNVSFGYDRALKILAGFSLTVQPGEHVTLTGRTGAGKSTVFKLLLGLYEPWSGNIDVFGQRAGQIREEDKRKLFGYVEQGFHPIPGTILDQITLGDAGIGREQAAQALKTAGLLDTVNELPLTMDTPYTSAMFSQGQIQLLSIARAVAADPQILLLDEVTANLDSHTEQKVLEALQAAARHRTVLSISHRLYEYTGGRRVEL